MHCNAADATTRADQRFTSYAFAHEFGSGIYDFNGRTLQVYSLPMGWNVIEPGKDQTGLRLRLPVTLGFLDFKPADVIESGLPDRADSVSFVPGVELNFVAGRWRLLPYVQAGLSTASRSNVESDLFGTGIRAERNFAAGNFAGLYAAAATYSHVSYRGDGALPDDDFMRLRNGVNSGAAPASCWTAIRSNTGCSPRSTCSPIRRRGPRRASTSRASSSRRASCSVHAPPGRSGKFRCPGSVSATLCRRRIGSSRRSRRAVLELRIQRQHLGEPGLELLAARGLWRRIVRARAIGPAQVAAFERHRPCPLAVVSWSNSASSCAAMTGSSTNTPCSQLSEVERGSRL